MLRAKIAIPQRLTIETVRDAIVWLRELGTVEVDGKWSELTVTWDAAAVSSSAVSSSAVSSSAVSSSADWFVGAVGDEWERRFFGGSVVRDVALEFVCWAFGLAELVRDVEERMAREGLGTPQWTAAPAVYHGDPA